MTASTKKEREECLEESKGQGKSKRVTVTTTEERSSTDPIIYLG
jgi:hypothetical protein